jgi:hypothetical protein
MPRAKDYWFVTRPKRKLNTIPEVLAAFCAVALDKKWTKNRELHIAFEEELENTGTKRVGERRDGSGSGGRTHAAMLFSLGLWFEKNDKVYLTLAGDAIMNGKPPVDILKKQVIRFQYPSAYSAKSVNQRFKIRPYIFLLRIINDSRICFLSQQEIAYIIALEAENETKECYEHVVNRVLEFRKRGEKMFEHDYFDKRKASKNNLMDVANTMMNWIDYTQLVYRVNVDGVSLVFNETERETEINDILNSVPKFYSYPVEPDIYQRQYGLDPWHQKDTRNLLNTNAVSSETIDKNRILKVFFNYSSLKPIFSITNEVIIYVSKMAGTKDSFTERVLTKMYPHGALGGYLSNYRNMAFQGRDEAVNFEIATANLFYEVFGYKTVHLGQSGSKSVPDVLLISDSEGYQALIDNKAYERYSISGDHHNRMVHNYIGGISNYSSNKYPIGFFVYISGGFSKNIDQQIIKVVKDSKVHGSAITVSNLISMIEKHMDNPYSHAQLKQIFGIDKKISLTDI